MDEMPTKRVAHGSHSVLLHQARIIASLQDGRVLCFAEGDRWGVGLSMLPLSLSEARRFRFGSFIRMKPALTAD